MKVRDLNPWFDEHPVAFCILVVALVVVARILCRTMGWPE
jgi:hypothetical protein